MEKKWCMTLVTGIVVVALAFSVICMQMLVVKAAGGNVLDACDTISGWNSHNTLSLDMVDKQEGSGSVQAVGNGTDWFKKAYGTPVNSGVTESDGYLDLWLYVSDVSQFNGGGQIEITSSGGPDVNEYNWPIGGLNLVNDWNHLHLKISDANKSGTPDLSAINYFRVYQFLSNSITVKVDYIRFSDDSGMAVLTYDDFESGWGNYTDGGGDASRYTGGTYAHQGSAAIDIQDNSGVASSFYHTNGIDVHTPGYTQIEVEFWFKAVSMDNTSEDFWVQYYDGSTWHTVASYARGTDFDNDVFYNKAITIDEATYTFPTDMKIRFMCDASGNKDDVYIDEVRVSASGGGGVPPTATNTPTPTDTPPPTNTPTPTPTPDGSEVDHTDPAGTGIITARAEINSSEGKEKAFDNLYVAGTQNVDWSKWLDDGGVPSAGDPSWIQIELPAMVVVDKLVIVSANDDFGRDPENFQLRASNDGTDWTTLATWSGEQFTSRFQSREFAFSNATEYSKYRLEITKNDEDVAMTQLCEIELRGPEGGTPVPTPTPSPTPTPTPVPQPGSARIINPTYGTKDVVVADYDVVSDYGADATGAIDATAAIQQALDDCYANGGGTVWVPAGTYKVTQSVLVKPFCTLRGDWQNPDVGTDYGTVIRAEIPTGDTPLFLIGGSAGVMGATVYYPNQSASSPVQYGWAFEIRGNGDTLGTANGNYNYHASSVVDVTLLNAYKGIGVNAPPYESNVHELSRVDNVKGTALYQGLDARNCADVGMWRYITFSNSYWAGAPAAYNPPSRSTLDSWTRANGTAFTLADVEWDSFYALAAEDYKVGIHLVDGARIAFAGQFAWAHITDTDVALKADANSIDARTPNWGASFLRSVLEGSSLAVENNSTGYIHITDSTVTGGIGGSYSGRVSTASPGTSPTSYTEIGMPPKPTRAVLYDVSQSPYNAPSTLGSLPTSDATSAIQSALDDAGNAGGGVVYLPAGWYKINTHLTVPANVELRGASSVMNRSQGGLSNGTVLFAYEGEGTADPEGATALITLNGNQSGVRGLRVFYPNNPFATADSFKVYPYAIRINGVDDAYVVNVAIENGYKGVVAEGGSDRHYIRNVVGATTHGFIRVWASTEGWIEDCHSNLNFWPRNGYGITPWMEEGGAVFWGSFVDTRKVNDRLIHIDDASSEHLMNNFTYGGAHGVHTCNANVNVFNIGTDNVGGYTVVREPGSSGTVNVMNSMRYNGNGNTSGVATTYNELNLD